MLDDVIVITQKIFSEFIKSDKQLSSSKAVYDSYRALSEVIADIQVVEQHYLAVDFTEPYLQNSSFKDAVDKWRYFLNRDLERLNSSVKKYLLQINQLAYIDDEDMFGSFLSKLYSAKRFYSFVRDDYNIGYIEPCSTQLISECLKCDFKEDLYYIEEFKRVDLSSYESRMSLKNELQDKNKVLITELNELKKYILKRYSIDDLL